ncbi:phosphoadenosine phosphosulfate reductase family protein [Moraxella sp. ZY210820]|uniref:phosphoadenosine phosphosulfate reductase domain-containing protein n=1 Tax=Moraxella sp. ZY210820 TaxID=2904123 RepID=UPI0027301EAA|nr:phosphoadenosine phosphosulfate reductase family protein [Moraxella sp. ZY210820]WLF84824.1 phosphoadenosine phosphosulfate reductase family protein [Moraxella sp. ZY210820]
MSNLFYPIQAQANVTDSVIVAFSGGKDSVVTLDLCCRYFKNVSAFFMYQVSNLSFQEATINWAEQKYGIEIERIPHFELSEFLAYGSFRHYDVNLPIIGMNDVYNYVRIVNDMWWIAAGERISDSIVRRAMMKKSGCIDEKRGRFYPIANFSKNDILRYIKHHKLKYAPETSSMGHSFRSLAGRDMFMLRQHYPKDYERVKSWFPYVEASILNYELNELKNGKE